MLQRTPEVLLLAGITALFLATGTAHAQRCPAGQDAFLNCLPMDQRYGQPGQIPTPQLQHAQRPAQTFNLGDARNSTCRGCGTRSSGLQRPAPQSSCQASRLFCRRVGPQGPPQNDTLHYPGPKPQFFLAKNLSEGTLTNSKIPKISGWCTYGWG